jgi:hypothetical protein
VQPHACCCRRPVEVWAATGKTQPPRGGALWPTSLLTLVLGCAALIRVTCCT